MRYITILMTILVFWFILGFTLTYVYSDTLLTSSNIEGNESYGIPDMSGLNMSTSEPVNNVTLKSFINMLQTAFLFRVPSDSVMPNSIAVIISFLNWFLVIVFGISVYRIANPISGG